MGLWWWRQSFVERERQETRGWTAVGGGADPPVRLLALSGAPGLRTVPRRTSRRHFLTTRHNPCGRSWSAFQAQRGARGEHLADAPRVLLAEAAPAAIVPAKMHARRLV